MRSGFTKKSIGTLTLGEKLRKIRSDKRMSLQEASRATKIQVAYLDFLEEGAYEKLPADVYVRGFLRSYADFLGVDDAVLIKLYEKEKEIKKNLEKNKNLEDKSSKKEKVNISSFVFTPKKIAAAGAILLVLSGLVYLYREVGSFASEPRLIILTPENNSETEENSVVVEGMTEKDANLFINDHPVLVSDEEKFREVITLQSGVNTIIVKSVNKFKKESVEMLTVSCKCQPETETEEKVDEQELTNIKSSEQLSLELRVDPGPVWLSVEADGGLVFSGTMLTGAVQTFHAKDKFVVNSGKSNATFVKFNGGEEKPLGTDAKAARDVVLERDKKE